MSLAVLLALGFALGRTGWCRLCGSASTILFLIQEDPVSKAVCLCTAALWFSDLLERALRTRPLAAGFFARLAPLGVATLAGALDPRLLTWLTFQCNAAFLAVVAAVAGVVMADSLVRMRRTGARSLIREYGQGSFTLLLLSLIGAASEEALFRGALLSSLASTFPMPIALLASAALFGLFHFAKGRPSGWQGVFETFLLGVLMGLLVLFTGGVAAAVLVHGLGLPYLLRVISSMRKATMEEAV